MIEIGSVHEIVRYPVKSMAGVVTTSARLGWHGLPEDRRFAVRRVDDKGGFPWVSASQFPERVLYQPVGLDVSHEEPLPTHVRTPDGAALAIGSNELDSHLSERIGRAVEGTRAKHGVFDEAALSVISQRRSPGLARKQG